jgi:hypothetical protein
LKRDTPPAAGIDGPAETGIAAPARGYAVQRRAGIPESVSSSTPSRTGGASPAAATRRPSGRHAGFVTTLWNRDACRALRIHPPIGVVFCKILLDLFPFM